MHTYLNIFFVQMYIFLNDSLLKLMNDVVMVVFIF